MKYPKPMLYVVVILALAALLYLIYLNKQIIAEGFSNTDGFAINTLTEKFQAMSDDQKAVVCKTLKDQIDQLNSSSNVSPDTVSTIKSQMDQIGCEK